MALSIKDETLDRSVRELARVTGRSLTGALRLAVDNELARQARPARDPEEIKRRIREIQAHVATLPVLDPRTPDEIVGYDENGMPA